MSYKRLPNKTAYESLTAKQRAFVDAYMGPAQGNITDAAEMAGYKASSRASLAVAGKQTLDKKIVFDAIQEIQALNPLVATRDERLQFLTGMMRDKAIAPKERLKAADQLAKACGDYIHKFEVSGPQGSPIQTQSTNITRLDLKNLTDEELKVLSKLLGE